jgi:pimeloyl-ACP methyl ester carboxylesterase
MTILKGTIMDRATRRRSLTAAVGLTMLLMTLAIVATTGSSAAAVSATAEKPTIVLVNGAWANPTSWSGVIARLQAEGYTVDAPPNPLRGLSADAATIADFLATIRGPVVLVGHSYGGCVITNAATGNPWVRALVYVDAFAPAKGESAFALDSSKPGSVLAAGPTKVFNFVPYPGASMADTLLYLKPAVFRQAFANGLPAREGAVLAATQEPVALSALTAPSGDPAWTHIQSWYVLGTNDHALPPAVQLFMARRIHAHITRVSAGHLSMLADPAAVAKVITAAALATG